MQILYELYRNFIHHRYMLFTDYTLIFSTYSPRRKHGYTEPQLYFLSIFCADLLFIREKLLKIDMGKYPAAKNYLCFVKFSSLMSLYLSHKILRKRLIF